jgi:uncharacterized protein YkwD
VTPTPGPVALAAQGSAVDAGQGDELLRLLNAERAKLGLSQLSANPQLAAAASGFAQYMATANFFAHNGPDGSRPESRVGAAGYGGSWRGETLAAGQSTAGLAFDVWWNQSPPHRAILTDPNVNEVGIGHFFGGNSFYGHYWVLETGLR